MIIVDYSNLIVESTESILDIVLFHQILRGYEDDPQGVLYPVTHKWRAVPLGSGGFFYSMEFINSWVLKFPNPGAYTILGNISCTIVPVSGVFVDRITSLAFATTGSGGTGAGGLTVDQASKLDSIHRNTNLIPALT